jgi:hypothetical protein
MKTQIQIYTAALLLALTQTPAAAVDSSPAETAARQRAAADLVIEGPGLLPALEQAEWAARAGFPIECDGVTACGPYAAIIGPLGRAVGQALVPAIRAQRLLLPPAIDAASQVAQPGD